MLLESVTLAALINVFKISGTAVSIVGSIFGVFKLIGWIKTKFVSIDKNVIELKNIMESNITGLRDDIKAQTNTIANELREQRADFRTFYAPTLLHMQSQLREATAPQPLVPVRAKRSVKKKVDKLK